MSSSSYTDTGSVTFTITHARHMAAKIATDLKRIQRLYGGIADDTIALFEAEATVLMKAGFLDYVIYGFQRSGAWIEPTLRYDARDLAGGLAADDDPGRIRPGRDVSGAEFASFLSYNAAYRNASQSEREQFARDLPFHRSSGSEPLISGVLQSDRTYSAGGRSLDRSSVRSY